MSTALLIRDETGRVRNDMVWALEPGWLRVTALAQFQVGDWDKVVEVIVLSSGGYGSRYGRMVRGWVPLTHLGYTGTERGDVTFVAGRKVRVQYWERARVGEVSPDVE